MDDVLEGEFAVSQFSFVDEEVFGGGVGEQEPEGLVIDEQIQAHLWGTSGTCPAICAGARGVVDGLQAVEGSAVGFTIRS